MPSKRFILRLAVLAIGVSGAGLAGTRFALAQEFRATVNSQVTDPSGAPIPSAAVTAVEHSASQTYANSALPPIHLSEVWF
jgi:hypothetical protein